MFSDANNSIVFWTNQQQRIIDAVLAKMVEIAEHDVANTKPTDEKWAPTFSNHSLRVILKADILVPADAEPVISFETVFFRGRRFLVEENHPANNGSIEITMGTTHFDTLRKGTLSFMQQCFRTIRTQLHQRFGETVFMQPSAEHIHADYVRYDIDLDVKVRDPPPEEAIVGNIAVM